MNGLPIAIAIAALFAPAAAIAQSAWERQSPYPADDHVHEVFFHDAERGWLVGYDGIFMRTADGGQTWEQSSSFPRSYFGDEIVYFVEFVDAQHGFAAGHHFFRTIDGGATWQEMPYQGQAYAMKFVTPQLGFLVVAGLNGAIVRRTTDGGQSFQSVFEGGAQDFDFITQSRGLVASYLGVSETTDGGATWQEISTQALTHVAYLTENIVIGVYNHNIGPFDHSFYRSSDGGHTWQFVFSDNSYDGGHHDIGDLEVIDADSIAAVDVNGAVWISDDTGLTWTKAHEQIGYWGNFSPPTWGLHFPDPQTGYAAGGPGIVLKSTDGGHTWKQISTGAALYWLDIEMHESGFGIAVGEDGAFLRTEDFGRTWIIGKVPPPQDALRSVQVIDADTAVACGDLVAFVRTDDGGRTWSHMENGLLDNIDFTLFDTHFLDEDHGWVFGGYDDTSPELIYETTDGGETWTRLPDALERGPLYEGEMLDPLNGYVLIPQTQLAVTHDNWSSVIDPIELPGASEVYVDLDFITPQLGWIGGRNGLILKTTDGAASFTFQTLPGFSASAGDELHDIRALSADLVYASTIRTASFENFARIYKSTNGGDTWTALPSFTTQPETQLGHWIGEVDALPTGGIWAASRDYSGYIFAADVPETERPAMLTDFAVAFGTLISGTLADLMESDDRRMHINSAIGFAADEPNVVDLRVGAQSPLNSAGSMDISIEGRLNNPGGNVRVRVRNWATNAFEEVHRYTLGMTEMVEDIPGIDATDRVRTSDGRIELSIRPSVVATFAISGFASYFDHIELHVRP